MLPARSSIGGGRLPGRRGFPEQVVHRSEEGSRLGLLDVLRRRRLRAGEIDGVDEILRNVVAEPRRRWWARLAPLHPQRGAGEDEALPRTRHSHVAEPPLLLEVRSAVGLRFAARIAEAAARMGQKALLHSAEKDAAPLQSLGAVQGHERDPIAGVAVRLLGVEGEPGEIPGQSPPEWFAPFVGERSFRLELLLALLVLDELPEQRLDR